MVANARVDSMCDVLLCGLNVMGSKAKQLQPGSWPVYAGGEGIDGVSALGAVNGEQK